jgi:hypothetical protein
MKQIRENNKNNEYTKTVEPVTRDSGSHIYRRPGIWDCPAGIIGHP